MTNKLREKKRGSSVPVEALSLIGRRCWQSASLPTVDEMLGELENAGYELGRSTVGKWMKKFNDAPVEVKKADSAFHWHQLDLADIPWEASQWVLASKKEFESHSHQSPERSEAQLKLPFRFTNREARWCWRVHHQAPDLSPGQVLSIASQYSYEEHLFDLIKHGMIPGKGMSPMEPEDSMVGFLNGLLTYQPWASDQNRRDFVSAIPDRIPFPSESLTWATWAYCLGAPAPDEFKFNFESPQQVPSMPPLPLHNTKEWFRDMEIIWGACGTEC